MTTSSGQTLSDVPVGVAPRTGTIRLLVEGWRFRPHSYALVNQQQCLSMQRRDDVAVTHLEHPTMPMLGEHTVAGLLTKTEEDALKAIPLHRKGAEYDAVYRIGYPYNLAAGLAKTFVFATCERLQVDPGSWVGGDGPIGEVVEKNDIIIITPSAWSRQGFINSGVNPDRVVIVPHGIDPMRFRPMTEGERSESRKKFAIDERFVFVNVSALTGNKNVGAVIEAFAAVVQKHPQALLVLKGLDDVYQSNKWLNVEMGALPAFGRWKASKSMSYVGSTVSADAIAWMYQTADCYVSPYKSEGFNIPVLEASACGLPVIVPMGGCTDDFVDDGFAVRIPASTQDDGGCKWLKTEVSDIAAAMERVITDSELRARSLRAGPENAQKYTWDRAVDRLLSVIAANLKGNQ